MCAFCQPMGVETYRMMDYNSCNYLLEVRRMEDIRLGDRIQTRKTHPCGSDEWTVIRTGADIKIKCLGCGRIVMMDRAVFLKRRKRVLAPGPQGPAKPE